MSNQILEDAEYIRNMIITKQPNGKYMKFSVTHDFICYMNEPKDKLYKYWKAKYKNYRNIPKKDLDILYKELENDLTPIEKMIDYIENAEWEPEREEAIKYLKGELI